MKEKSYRIAGNYLMWQGGRAEVPADVAAFLQRAKMGDRFTDASIRCTRDNKYMYLAYWGGQTDQLPEDVAKDVRDTLNGLG